MVRMLIGGFGGQGVIMLGQMLGAAAISSGKNATFYPTYGPEQRGGTANCAVVISDKEIGSPIVTRPDVLICFNQTALEKFLPTLKPGGMLFVNSSQFSKEHTFRGDFYVIRVAADTLAQELGNAKVANAIMMGAVIQKTEICTPEHAEAGIVEELMSKSQLHEVNIKALKCGMLAVRS